MSVKIIKKNNTVQEFNSEKIINAVRKSADRACTRLTNEQENAIVDYVLNYLKLNNIDAIEVNKLHNIVENALESVDCKAAKCYRNYRNYKTTFAEMIDHVYRKKLELSETRDNSNANADSSLVTTQKAITYSELNGELYKRFFLTDEEHQAMQDGYIYIHDRGARLDCTNCFTRDTKFITSDGVKSFYDFKEGDTVRVISHKGVWRKATVIKLPWSKIQRVWFKRGSGKETYVDCTPNHRWILNDGTVTTSLKIGDRLYPVQDRTAVDFNNLTREQKRLWCLGFAFADGSIGVTKLYNYLRIRLCGHKTSFKENFEKAGYVVKPIKNSTDLQAYMFDTSCKRLPYNMDEESIRIFMNGYMSADGSQQLENGVSSPYRGLFVAGEFNDWVYDFLNIAGYYVTRIKDMSGKNTNYGIRKDRSLNYGLYSSTGPKYLWQVTRIEEISLNPKANVWCLDVEEDHSFLLEKGIPTGNCSLLNVADIFKGGFKMGNIDYREPRTVGTAISLMTDIMLNAGAAQYGGLTVSNVDSVLAQYAENSYNDYYNEYIENYSRLCDNVNNEKLHQLADKYAIDKVRKEIRDGFIEIECRLNSTTTARGDFIFSSISFGLDTTKFGSLISSEILNVRKNSLGTKTGIPVLFPKLTFMYDEKLHGEGKQLEWLFLEAVDCTMRAQYPDFLSMSGDGYAPSMYKKYGVTISRMGCRANLSPWYERGGIEPADEFDKPIYEGRFNCGALSLHFPMIVAKAKAEGKDFFDVLEYYLQLCRKIHIRTLDFLSHKKAGINPLAFCEGGFYNGNKKPDEEIGRDFLKPATVSFGITALNEATVMYNGKTIYEDNSEFADKVLQYINDFANKYKKEDGILYAIYGTPAESLASLQVQQFRKKYGIIKGVSDREYTTNSFHMHVTEDISPIEKQDAEYKCFHKCNGGNIMYNRFTSEYNKKAYIDLIRRAMRLGYYYGCNKQQNFCEHCGAEFIDAQKCPKCGSEDITQIDRVCGYLGYTRIKGYSMMNSGKVAEIRDRKSM